MNDELPALVKGVLADLSDAGVGALADWLAEHDREREAVLLRKRCKRWNTERAARTKAARDTEESIAAPMRDAVASLRAAVASLRAAGFQCTASIHVKASEDTASVDESFRTYIRSRFGGVRVEQVKFWFPEAGFFHVVGGESGGFVHCACGMMASGRAGKLPTPPKRICRKCRKALATATLRTANTEVQTA